MRSGRAFCCGDLISLPMMERFIGFDTVSRNSSQGCSLEMTEAVSLAMAPNIPDSVRAEQRILRTKS